MNDILIIEDNEQLQKYLCSSVLLVGIFSIITFATSIFIFHAVTTFANWAMNIFRDYLELNTYIVILVMLFLISSCIVLYYKIASDTDEEAENISMLKKIGLTVGECRRYLQIHIAIIFFLLLLFGGTLGLYLTYQFFQWAHHTQGICLPMLL